MSLWIPHRDAQGRLYFYTVNVPLLLIAAIFGVCVTTLMALAMETPLEALAISSGMVVVGFASFLRAKLSVCQQGFWLSFGSARMTVRMRRFYRFGYCLMIPGALVAGLLSLLIVCIHG